MAKTTAAETPAQEPQQPPKRTRKAVPMVTKHPDEIAFEVAAETEIPTGRGRGGATVLSDAQQKKIEQAVEASYTQGKWLTAIGVPGSERELVKRVRAAAAKLGYGVSLGQATENAQGVRLPFKAGKRRVYKGKNA